MHCPCCDSAESGLLGTMGDRLFRTTDRKFELHQCVKCRVVFLSPLPTRSELSLYYPSNYWWQALPEAGLSSFWHKLLEIYRRVMIRRTARRIRLLAARSRSRRARHLDVGCGDGLLLASCQGLPLIRVGVDMSTAALHAAKQRGGIGVARCSFEALPFSSGSFAVITLIHVLEHLPSPASCLQQLCQVLEPEGWLVVQLPNSESLQRRLLGSRWAGFDVPRHLVNYSRENLRAMLESNGFRVTRVSQISLRDSPATIVMSLFPSLYPPARRIGMGPRKRVPLFTNGLLDLVYLLLVLAATPLALVESLAGRGGTIVVEAQKC